MTQASRLYEVLKQRLSITAIKPLSQNSKARDSVFAAFSRMLEKGISNTLVAKTETEVQLFIKEFKAKKKELDKSIQQLELSSKIVLNALGTSRLCLYR